MKKYTLPLTLIFILLSLPFIARSQNVDEEFIRQHLDRKQYTIDPEAAAVTLYEKATVEIIEVANKYQEKYSAYTLIKVLDASAFDEGDVQYVYPDINSHVGAVEGTTYNLENNTLQKTKLEKSSVYYRVINAGYKELKFAMPAVKEGSIIEYSYTVYTDMNWVMPEWYFQGDYPVLNSEYELIYPLRHQFMTVLQSPHTFKEYNTRKDAITQNAPAYRINAPVGQKQASVLWGRRDLPAAEDEPFISSLSNHIERLDIQLSAYVDPGSVTGMKHVVTNWDKFTTELLDWDYIGGRLNESKDYLKSVMPFVLKDAATDLDKAKAIFNYCRNTFHCTDSIEIGSERKLKTVFAGKEGSAAELNMILISMLRKAGLNAYPIVLSTLGHLKADDMYPMVNRFNYTTCLLKIGTQRYLLDASNRYNPFGILPAYCYNGYARILDKKESDSIYISSNMLKEKDIKKVTIFNITDTSIDIKITEIPGMITSRAIRNIIDGKEDKKNEYIREHTLRNDEALTMKSCSFEALNNPDTNLVITYTLHRKFEKPSSILYLNTDYLKYFDESPFKSMKRQLPVELPFQMDYIYSLNLEIPKDYTPESLPEPSVLTFEGNQMSFKHLVGYDKDVKLLTVTTRFTTNKTYFPVSSYDVIRQFFEKMIYETNQVITLKKS